MWRKWSGAGAGRESGFLCALYQIISFKYLRSFQDSLTQWTAYYGSWTWAYSTGSVFHVKCSQDVLILSLWQETEAFAFNEASLLKSRWSDEHDCVAHLPVCTGQSVFTLLRRRREQSQRATYLPKLRQSKMEKRWLFSLFCVFSVPRTAGKCVSGMPWLSWGQRVARGRVARAGWGQCVSLGRAAATGNFVLFPDSFLITTLVIRCS